MAAVLAERMGSVLPDWQLVLQLQIREIERRYASIHEDLLDWGRWGRRMDEGKPQLVSSGLWRLPGDPDPDRDPDAVPEPVALPIEERRILELDRRIHRSDFPAVWRKVLAINYVGVRVRGYRATVVEWQRPRAAGESSEGYRLHLATAMRYLDIARGA